MRASMQPANSSRSIDDRRTGQLRDVLDLRRAPILRETRGLVLGSPLLQRAIGEELEQVDGVETHRTIRAFVLVADAQRSCILLRAELFGFCLRTDRDEADRDAPSVVLVVELAQLRERLSEKRSTDVPQPNDQRRQRSAERRYRSRQDVPDRWC